MIYSYYMKMLFCCHKAHVTIFTKLNAIIPLSPGHLISFFFHFIMLHCTRGDEQQRPVCTGIISLLTKHIFLGDFHFNKAWHSSSNHFTRITDFKLVVAVCAWIQSMKMKSTEKYLYINTQYLNDTVLSQVHNINQRNCCNESWMLFVDLNKTSAPSARPTEK